MNAEQFLRTTNKLIDCIKNKDFKHVEFNGVNMYLYVKDTIMFSITKLFKELNRHTKTASSGASIFVRQNIIEKGWIEQYPNKFMNVKGKGTQEFKGMYVSLDLLREWLIPIGGLHAYRWFIDDDAWFEALGKGWVYVIRTPQHAKSNVIKYGRTINLDRRFNIYLTNSSKEQQAIGVEVIGFAYVENQSEAEDAIASIFDQYNCLSTDDGREYRLINDDDEEDAREIAFEFFEQALQSINVDSASIQYFAPGANIFRYKRDTQ